jgi:hypothetical protein
MTKTARQLNREINAAMSKPSRPSVRLVHHVSAPRSPRASRSRHKDVEFAVNDAGGRERIFKTADEAAGFAITVAMARGKDVNVDVLIHSKAGARWYGGDDAAEQYDEDPDASVSDRIVVRAESIGRVS